MLKNLYKRIGTFLVERHKLVQWVGYEPSNTLLLAKNFQDTGACFWQCAKCGGSDNFFGRIKYDMGFGIPKMER